MKIKILLLLPVVFLLSFGLSYCNDLPSSKAEQSVYMRVVDNKTPFFLTTTDSIPLFYLPCSYFVKIIGQTENFYHVECFGVGTPAIDGLVPKSKLVEIDYQVENPYMQATITTISSCMLYSDCSAKQSLYHIFADRTLNLYGTLFIEGEENLYLVCYNDKLGYVKESCIKPFVMPTHPIPLPQEQKPQNTQTTEIKSPSNNVDGLKTAIIICLALAGVIALCLAVKRKNKPSHASATTFVDDDF